MTQSFRNKTHIMRIMNDLREFHEEKTNSTIFVVPQEDDISLLHGLIIGPPETPYENGFFYFMLRYAEDYPLNPPRVELKTTFRKTVRFGPNLYADGKVCLSILGTWTGPAWAPSMTLFHTLLSMQSVMDAKPYHNEPGYEEKNRTGRGVAKDVSDYNDVIAHETLRIAVIEMLQASSVDASEMPTALKEIMIAHFTTNYTFYENLIVSNLHKDGQPMRDPHRGDRPSTFSYRAMSAALIKLREKFGQAEGGTAGVLSYNEIAKKTLMSSTRDVLTVDEDDFEDDYSQEVNTSALYVSESDNDEEQSKERGEEQSNERGGEESKE